jgi:hypothetical protein
MKKKLFVLSLILISVVACSACQPDPECLVIDTALYGSQTD